VLFSRCSETEAESVFFFIVREIGSLKMEVIDFATDVYEFFNSKQSICESCYCVGLLLNCKTLCLG
jgi:hypothetical protein